MPIQKLDFELSSEYQQLALDLELPEIEIEGVSPEEARRRAEVARSALNQLKGTDGQPPWYDVFEYLIHKGWTWRQATYIAWASMPRLTRVPKTQDELAKRYLGLTSDRAVSVWRQRNPAIDQEISLLQSAPLWDYRGDSFNNLNKGMMKSGEDYKYFDYLKMHLEMTGDYIPISKLTAELTKRLEAGDLSEENEENLRKIAASIQEQLKRKAGGANG